MELSLGNEHGPFAALGGELLGTLDDEISTCENRPDAAVVDPVADALLQRVEVELSEVREHGAGKMIQSVVDELLFSAKRARAIDGPKSSIRIDECVACVLVVDVVRKAPEELNVVDLAVPP